MRDRLTPLANKYGCDKGSIKHNYTKIYDRYFRSMRNEKFEMLEIGFGKGASIKMWADYFSAAIIYCADISKNLPQNKGRLKFFTADQSSEKQMLEAIGDRQFKIIIDDGSHVAEDQQRTFGFLFPHLVDGGWYIIEDLKCKRAHKTERTAGILKKCNKPGSFYSEVLAEDRLIYINNHINKVKVYNGIAFIKKRSSE